MGEVIELKTKNRHFQHYQLKNQIAEKNDISLLYVNYADDYKKYIVKYMKDDIGFIKVFNNVHYFYLIYPDCFIRGDLLEIILEVVRDLNEIR